MKKVPHFGCFLHKSFCILLNSWSYCQFPCILRIQTSCRHHCQRSTEENVLCMVQSLRVFPYSRLCWCNLAKIDKVGLRTVWASPKMLLLHCPSHSATLLKLLSFPPHPPYTNFLQTPSSTLHPAKRPLHCPTTKGFSKQSDPGEKLNDYKL